jgi:CheY-like chemotaxis protein
VLADDHPAIATAVGALLALDCEVLAIVGDGSALLEATGRLKPDVIVLDLNMPNVTGLEACRLITRRLPDVKVIMITALNDSAIKQAAFVAGAAAFVLKQEIAEHLLPTLQRVCGG